MDITFIFFVGLVISFVGVIPPGMLNMSAAKISLKEGHNRSFMFSIGVCIIVALQTYIAATFAKYLSENSDVSNILKRVALVIFILISIYFFVTAKSNPKHIELNSDVRSKQSRFFQGLFLSLLNIFPIPFQVYVLTTLLSIGWIVMEGVTIGAYIAGTSMGTFIALYVYILFFDNLKNNKFMTTKNINYSISLITMIIAITTIINLLGF